MASGGNINYTINVNSAGAVNGIGSVSNAFNNLRNSGYQLLGLGAVLTQALTVPFIGAVKQGIEFDSMIQQANVNFGTLLSSMDKGVAMVDKIKSFADITPFQMPELMEAGKLMLAYGVSAEKVMPSIEMLGDIAMGNKARFERLSLAFSQVTGTGRLMGQDLLQLVSAGFNPLQVISEKTGKSMLELRKIMEKGGISAKLVAATMQMATQEGGKFYEQMQKASKTFEGRLSTLKDAIASTLGVVMMPLFKVLSDTILPVVTTAVKNLATWFNSLSEKTKITALALTALVTVGLPAMVMLAGFAGLLLAAISPLMLWVGAIFAAISALGYFLIVNSDFRNNIIALWNNVAIAINDTITSLANAALSIVQNWKTMDSDSKAIWKSFGISFIDLTTVMIAGVLSMAYTIAPAIQLIINSFTAMMKASTLQQAVVSKDFKAIKLAALDLAITQVQLVKNLDDLKNGFVNAGAEAVEWGKNAKNALEGINVDKFAGFFEDMKQYKIPGIDTVEAEKKLQGIFGMKPDVKIDTNITDDAKITIDDLNKLLAEGSKKAAMTVDTLNSKVKNLVQSVLEQTKAFANFVGMFDKVQLAGTSSGDSLMRRLEKQIKTMTKWKDALGQLRGKLGEGGTELMQSITEQGVGATKQVVGLNKLSPEKLQKYNELYKSKMGMAQTEAISTKIYEAQQEKKVNNIVFQITGNQIKDDIDIDTIAQKLVTKLKLSGVF